MEKFTILILCIVLCVCIFYAAKLIPPAHALTDAGNLLDCIHLAMNYLDTHIQPSGRVVYVANVDPKIRYSDKQYNALRHAGTLYSMYLCEIYLNDYSLKEQRIKSSEYFIKEYVKKIGADMYAVISKPEEEGGKHLQAKLGGSGLALIALSNLLSENKIDIKTLEGMGNFILSMQLPDGNYNAKYDLGVNKIDKSFVSLYYPGEAALGLLYLYDVRPNEKWLLSAKKALLYLADSRKNSGLDVPFDHWAMIATQKLFETKDNGLTGEEKTLLQRHAEQMANSILDTVVTDKNSLYRGSLRGNIAPCSLGTRMEGLAAIYNIIDDKKMKKRILEALDLGTDFLNRTQIKTGETKGALPSSADWSLKKPNSYESTVRIDNVQHVMSAWIMYRNILLSIKS